MTANRDCAEIALAKLADVADGTKGGRVSPETGAIMAAAYALLDVADAIREQTTELHSGVLVDGINNIEYAIRHRGAS